MTVDADHFPARFRQQQFFSLYCACKYGCADLATVLCSGWNSSLARIFGQRDDCE